MRLIIMSEFGLDHKSFIPGGSQNYPELKEEFQEFIRQRTGKKVKLD